MYEWNIVRSYKEFVEWLDTNGIPLVVSFDHDLHEEHIRSFLSSYRCGVIEYGNFKEKTGKHCAEYLVEKCKKMNVDIPICYVHSANPIGRANIKEILSL